MYELESLYDKNESTQSLTAGADVFTHSAAVPIEIVSFGFIITTAMAGTSGFVAAIDRRITAGSDTGRVDDIATLTLTNAQALLQVAGNVIRSRVYDSGATEGALTILPGQQAIIEVATPMSGGGAAGNGIPFIEYKQLPRLDRASTIELVVST